MNNTNKNIIYDNELVSYYKEIYQNRNKNKDFFYYNCKKYNNLYAFTKRKSDLTLEEAFLFLKTHTSMFSLEEDIPVENEVPENNEKEDPYKDNFFIKLLKHIKIAIKAVINFIKSFAASSINFIKYVIKWIQEKTTNHSEIYRRYKDLINKVPKTMKIDAINFRKTFYKDSLRLLDLLRDSKLTKIIEEVNFNLKAILDMIKSKTFEPDKLDIKAANLKDPQVIFDLYEEFQLFMVSLAKIDRAKLKENVSVESQMKEKLCIEFFGTLEEPQKGSVLVSEIVTPENCLSLLPAYSNKIKSVVENLKSINGKVSFSITISTGIYKACDIFNDLWLKHAKNKKDKEMSNLNQFQEYIELVIKWSKLINMFIKSVKFSTYFITTWCMNFRLQVANTLKGIGANVMEDNDTGELYFN